MYVCIRYYKILHSSQHYSFESVSLKFIERSIEMCRVFNDVGPKLRWTRQRSRTALSTVVIKTYRSLSKIQTGICTDIFVRLNSDYQTFQCDLFNQSSILRSINLQDQKVQPSQIPRFHYHSENVQVRTTRMFDKIRQRMTGPLQNNFKSVIFNPVSSTQRKIRKYN